MKEHKCEHDKGIKATAGEEGSKRYEKWSREDGISRRVMAVTGHQIVKVRG